MDKEELVKLDKETLAETVLSLQKSVDELLKNNELLLEALKISKQRTYGKASEVNSNDQLTLELSFNEAESLYDKRQSEPELNEAAPRKKKSKGKKKNDLSKITDHREEFIELSDDELKNFMDWFTGQCSDGWGEGLEQNEVEHTTWEDREAIDNCEDVPQYASDCVDFEEWCKCEGYDIPEDEESEEYNDLYQEYEEAETRALVETYYFVTVWPKNFKISKI